MSNLLISYLIRLGSDLGYSLPARISSFLLLSHPLHFLSNLFYSISCVFCSAPLRVKSNLDYAVSDRVCAIPFLFDAFLRCYAPYRTPSNLFQVNSAPFFSISDRFLSRPIKSISFRVKANPFPLISFLFCSNSFLG